MCNRLDENNNLFKICVSLKLDSEVFSLVEFKCSTIHLTSYSCHSTVTSHNAVASHARSTSSHHQQRFQAKKTYSNWQTTWSKAKQYSHQGNSPQKTRWGTIVKKAKINHTQDVTKKVFFITCLKNLHALCNNLCSKYIIKYNQTNLHSTPPLHTLLTSPPHLSSGAVQKKNWKAVVIAKELWDINYIKLVCDVGLHRRSVVK